MIGKKAQAMSETLYWVIPRILYIMVVVLSIVFIVRAFYITNISVESAESLIFINRMVNGPNALSHFDYEIERLYPGVLNTSQFSPANTKGVVFGVDRAIAAQFNLTLEPDEPRSFIQRVIVAAQASPAPENEGGYSLKYNKLWYEKWLPLAQLGLRGAGGVFRLNDRRYALTADNFRGTLNTTVIIPKS